MSALLDSSTFRDASRLNGLGDRHPTVLTQLATGDTRQKVGDARWAMRQYLKTNGILIV
jgi:hypothetical protein